LSAVIELSDFTAEEVLIEFRIAMWKGPVSTDSVEKLGPKRP